MLHNALPKTGRKLNSEEDVKDAYIKAAGFN